MELKCCRMKTDQCLSSLKKPLKRFGYLFSIISSNMYMLTKLTMKNVRCKKLVID